MTAGPHPKVKAHQNIEVLRARRENAHACANSQTMRFVLSTPVALALGVFLLPFLPPSVGLALLPVVSASVTPVFTSLFSISTFLTLLGSICLCFLDMLRAWVLPTSIGLFLFYGTLVRSCAWPSFVFLCRVFLGRVERTDLTYANRVVPVLWHSSS